MVQLNSEFSKMKFEHEDVVTRSLQSKCGCGPGCGLGPDCRGPGFLGLWDTLNPKNFGKGND